MFRGFGSPKFGGGVFRDREPQGLKPDRWRMLYAALKRRSSTLLHTSTSRHAFHSACPPSSALSKLIRRLLTKGDQQGSHTVEVEAFAWGDNRGGAVFGDDGWAGVGFAGLQGFAGVDCGR